MRSGFGNNVTSVYNFLTSSDQSSNNVHNTIIWHKKVSLNVNIFVWCLLRNRLPTTDNLTGQMVLQPNTFFFSQEVAAHKRVLIICFLTCDYFKQIWYESYNRLIVVLAKLARVEDHLLLFRSLGGF